jgi:hypothetical protein
MLRRLMSGSVAVLRISPRQAALQSQGVPSFNIYGKYNTSVSVLHWPVQVYASATEVK